METKGGELSFDDCSRSAVQAIHDGSYFLAATLATMAYNATSDPSEKARMARDAGNAYSHLGNYEKAEKWLAEAVNQHETLAEQEPNRSTLRELGASAAMLATMQLSRIASDETFDTPENNTETVETFRYGLEKLKDSHKHADGLNRIDQYDINFTARASYAETLAGNKKRGLALGIRAVRLAFWSESPRLDTTNTSLSKKERYKTKARALVRGIGALAVGIVAPINRRAAKTLVRKLS
jgi:tetratricopeptide (TPR) repeat protein